MAHVNVSALLWILHYYKIIPSSNIAKTGGPSQYLDKLYYYRAIQ